MTVHDTSDQDVPLGIAGSTWPAPETWSQVTTSRDASGPKWVSAEA